MLGLFVWLGVGLVLALALVLRLYNVDWDQNTHLHPDERHLTVVANDIELPGSIAEYFDSEDSRLNPYNRENSGSFVYGTLPLFLTKAVAATLGLDDYDHLVLVGRHLSALFDLGSVVLAFLIGRRLYGPLAGAFAAAFMATAPLAIQHSHFFVVDPFMTFFTALVLYSSVRIAQEGRQIDFAMAGLALGLGMACKVTAVLVAPVIVAAVCLRVQPAALEILRQQGASLVARRTITRSLLGLFVAGLLAFLAFRVAQPYAFDAPRLANLAPWTIGLDDRWLDDQKNQSRLLGGDAAYPPSLQWTDRDAYLYPLQAMVQWGMAPGFGFASWLSLLYAGYRLVRFRELVHLLPLVFIAGYFGFMGGQFSLYLRYFLPLYPVLAVLAGWGLVTLVARAREWSRRLELPALEQVAAAGVALTLVLALLAGLAYFSIYSRPVTRIEASRWLHDTLPAGSTIASEHWDDTLPIRLPGAPDKSFEVIQLGVYEADNEQKLDRLIADLDRSDYVALSSNRALNSIPRAPAKYPSMTLYYESLVNGQLGFREVREFTSNPGLLGLEFADHRAEESLSSYDHPRVLVFQKTPEFSPERARQLLSEESFALAGITPAQADRNGLMLRPADLETQREGGTWTDVFSDSGLAANYPTLLWLFALQAAAFAVTPLTLVLFRSLPDRGYLLTKPLGMLLLAYIVWLLVSLKLVEFHQSTVLSVLALLLAGCGAVVYRWRDEILGFLREHWRFVLFCEALFLLTFFGFRELRIENPDLWHPGRGGEKPMDLAYLTAVTRSTTLPPYDAWFAGGYINYYYMGQFFTATLVKLTTIAPELAFNLAVPTFASLTAAATFSAGYNLAAAARRLLRRGPGFQSIAAWTPYAAGILAVFLVLIAGNLDGVGQIVDRLSRVSSWHLNSGLPVVDSVANSIGGVWKVLFHGKHLEPFDYWRPSRMMPPAISITEFPYFSFLFADLHAHMMAIAFQVLAIGIGAALVLGAPGDRNSAREWAIVALLGLVVGGLRWLNSWDYPPFLLLAIACVLISERRLEGSEAGFLVRTALKCGLLVAISFLAYQPFLANYQSPVNGIQAAPETSQMHQYLAHFGVFAALVGAWLLFQLWRALRTNWAWRFLGSNEMAALTTDQITRLVLAGGVMLLLLALTLYLLQRGNGFVAMLLPVMLLLAYLTYRELRLQRPDSGIRLFVLALLGLGLGLSMGVDLVTLKGDIQRMNTVFKFYLHIWVVFAVAAAFVTWHLAFVTRRPSFSLSGSFARRIATSGAVASLVLLLFGALLYPLFATPPRLDERFGTRHRGLDGMAYMQDAVYQDEHGPIDLSRDREGIQWLRHNVHGTPVIVEGRAPLYRWGGRFSIYTGLPTVIGWDWHQTQQRGELAFMVAQRLKDVDAFYSAESVVEAQSFLRVYDVSYVIVGGLERNYYPASGLAKFAAGLGGVLDVVFTNGGLTIYRVDESALTPALAGLP